MRDDLPLVVFLLCIGVVIYLYLTDVEEGYSSQEEQSFRPGRPEHYE